MSSAAIASTQGTCSAKRSSLKKNRRVSCSVRRRSISSAMYAGLWRRIFRPQTCTVEQNRQVNGQPRDA